MYLPYASVNLRGASAPRVPSKKSGFSLALHHHSERHSSDRFTSPVPLQCAIEVKEEDGGYLEARSQLSTWQSAAMWHGRSEVPEAEGELRLPAELYQIGWLVIRRKWDPSVSSATPAGDHVSIGPVFGAEMGIADLVSLYRLLAVLRAQMDWLLGTIWPGFEKVISAAIARLHERSEERL
ncbi:Hypothetical protein D9617_48g089430 [Elsinoe fawcettii]|nr:Hypothetical protein D9617_48g089430 [Elsinoe fawcettii]